MIRNEIRKVHHTGVHPITPKTKKHLPEQGRCFFVSIIAEVTLPIF